MIFQNEIDINQPIDKVVTLGKDPSNCHKWQPWFVSFELLSEHFKSFGEKDGALDNIQ